MPEEVSHENGTDLSPMELEGRAWEMNESPQDEEIFQRNGRRFTIVSHQCTSRVTELPIEAPDFDCPVCGSSKFDFHLVNSPHDIVGILKRQHITVEVIGSYSCAGCSTTFQDPVRFSKNRPET